VVQAAADGDGEGWMNWGGETVGVAEAVVGVGLADTAGVGLAETRVIGVGVATVRAAGVAPQPARTNATVNAAAAAPILDLTPV